MAESEFNIIMQMYKVFINDRVICFTNNQECQNQFEQRLVITFFVVDNISNLLDLINGPIKINIVIVLPDFELAFKEFQSYFKVIKAAGGIVSNENNEKLFIYRLGKWDLPKGKIEKGEEIELAATREIEEECGITDISIQDKLQDTFHIYTHKEQLILKHTYWFKMKSNYKGKLVPQLEENITKVEWLSNENIKSKVLINTYDSIKELL